uniref:Uncharacterized protein n=1 Tax=Oryza punctata TaxID=4537 RepID=A0A0E0JWH9_ORYPU
MGREISSMKASKSVGNMPADTSSERISDINEELGCSLLRKERGEELTSFFFLARFQILHVMFSSRDGFVYIPRQIKFNSDFGQAHIKISQWRKTRRGEMEKEASPGAAKCLAFDDDFTFPKASDVDLMLLLDLPNPADCDSAH